MGSLNKVFLVGNLGRDPEARETKGGTKVASFSLCTTERVKQADNTYADKPEWHNCVAFGKTADVVLGYLAKGSRVHIEGKLQTDTYEKEGQKHYATKIVVFQVQFLGGKRESENATAASNASGGDGLGLDDEIPF